MIRNVLLLLGGCIFTLQAYAAPVPESEQPFYAESELQSELPVGNYLLICKNCEVDDDNQLSCSCPESLPAEQIASGEPVEPTYNPQTVDLTRCESGRVVYLDGYIFVIMPTRTLLNRSGELKMTVLSLTVASLFPSLRMLFIN